MLKKPWLSPYDPKHPGDKKMPQPPKKLNEYDFGIGYSAPSFDPSFAETVSALIRERANQSRLMTDPAQTVPRSELRSKVERFIVTANSTVPFSSIIGNETAKQALISAISDSTKYADMYTAYGMSPIKGALLYGPPGCGKTMLAKASLNLVSSLFGTAGEMLVINGPELQDKFVGETEKKIRQIFAYGREYYDRHKHPLVVFIDEAEAVFPQRKTGMLVHNDFVTAFLSEMDGLRESKIFLILASNRPEDIDEAVLRDGRISRKIEITRPNEEEFRAMVALSIGTVPAQDSPSVLANVAVECFYDPSRVIVEAERIKVSHAGMERMSPRHFCLEHIVSGAMAASVIPRAKQFALDRDKAVGRLSGIGTQDIIDAVNQIFEENRGLKHAFAFNEWYEEMVREATESE